MFECSPSSAKTLAMTGVPEHSLRGAKLTALFCVVAAALYAVAEAEPSPIVGLFFAVAPLITVILWLQRDARTTGVATVHDLGFLMWISWPVLIPWYAWRTRGVAGWRLTLGLFGMIFSAHVTWLVVAWSIYAIRYGMWYLETRQN